MQLTCRFIAVLIGLACCSFAFGQASESIHYYLGRTFWYEPAHEKYAPIHFHRVPDFDREAFNLSKKTKFEIIAARRGWFQLRLEPGAPGGSTAFIPMLILRKRLYAPSADEPYRLTFRNSSIFDEDPDAIQARFDAADKPLVPASKPRPWVRYR